MAEPRGAADAEAASAVPATQGRLKRIAGGTLAFVAVAYIATLIAKNSEDFWQGLQALSIFQLACAMLAAITMLLLKAVYHVRLCERLSGKASLSSAVLPAYVTAQVVRYLPGKIWGVVYQASRLSQTIGQREVVTANAIQTVTTNLLGLSIIVSGLAAFHFEQPLLLAGVGLGIALVELVHRVPRLESWLLGLAYKVGKGQRPPLAAIPPLPLVGTSILIFEWLAYFLMWQFLAAGFPNAGFDGAVLMGLWYAAASLVAVFAIAVPGGIAVREAAFVAIAAAMGASPAALLALAAAARIVLTAGELACIPMATIYVKIRSAR